MDSFIIRDCVESDLEAIQGIYGYYVQTSTCTYEEEIANVDEIRRRWTDIRSNGMPFLIAESVSLSDRKVVGYSYVSKYRERSGWRFTVENSIYIDNNYLGKGIGRLLLRALIDKCKNETPFEEIIAVIGGGLEHTASIRLHTSFGFQMVGIMKNTGFKFNKKIDTAIMQLSISRDSRNESEI